MRACVRVCVCVCVCVCVRARARACSCQTLPHVCVSLKSQHASFVVLFSRTSDQRCTSINQTRWAASSAMPYRALSSSSLECGGSRKSCDVTSCVVRRDNASGQPRRFLSLLALESACVTCPWNRSSRFSSVASGSSWRFMEVRAYKCNGLCRP